MPREVNGHNCMTVPRRRLREEIEEGWRPIAAATFSNQSERVLDQLRGIEMNKLFFPERMRSRILS